MSATIGRLNVNRAMDELSTIIWAIRDAINSPVTPYCKDAMKMWKQHLLTATAILSDIQNVMKDEWEQEIEDANNLEC